jgi:4'-phosphopantetheinyl transferase
MRRNITLIEVPIDSSSDIAAHEKILSSEERQRSERFRCSVARGAFVTMRSTLRICLADILGSRARDLRFDYTVYGKPYLSDPKTTIKFNVSHTYGLGLIAIHPSAEVGVDIEKIRFEKGIDQIANQFCSAVERQALKSLSGISFVQGFFRCWTRKEAVLKMIGCGLSVDTRLFSVSVDHKARILDSKIEKVNSRCELINLEMGTKYAACLCMPN